jgi:hypothetical protein
MSLLTGRMPSYNLHITLDLDTAGSASCSGINYVVVQAQSGQCFC